MTNEEQSFSRAAIALLRGVVERGRDEALWQVIVGREEALRDYLGKLGLHLFIDRADEYAYLRQDESSGLPRLMARTQLSYALSLLLLLLRKKLGEYDAHEGDSRLILTTGEMTELLAPFFPAVTDQVRFADMAARQVQRAEELGFLRRMTGEDASYEVLSLLRSFITAEWLQDFDERLKTYAAYGTQEETDDGLI
ncbi:MAG: DUF4194 domain-containing protein [Selenomonadaceae bacterium]|nr:DUF4194 domain-containing protein [Selenomonadaceae bacterium]